MEWISDCFGIRFRCKVRCLDGIPVLLGPFLIVIADKLDRIQHYLDITLPGILIVKEDLTGC